MTCLRKIALLVVPKVSGVFLKVFFNFSELITKLSPDQIFNFLTYSSQFVFTDGGIASIDGIFSTPNISYA